MDKQTHQQWAQRAVYAVNAAFPQVEFKSWSSCEALLPHALVCAELIKDCNMKFPEAGQLLTQAGWYLKERAQYVQAELLLTQGLEIRETVLGPEHSLTQTIRRNYTSLLLKMGRGSVAKQLKKDI